jgi:hypothetical protein
MAIVVGYFLALKKEQDELMRVVVGLERGSRGQEGVDRHEEHGALMQTTDEFINVEILE